MILSTDAVTREYRGAVFLFLLHEPLSNKLLFYNKG
jgi:hypothetical protein